MKSILASILLLSLNSAWADPGDACLQSVPQQAQASDQFQRVNAYFGAIVSSTDAHPDPELTALYNSGVRSQAYQSLLSQSQNQIIARLDQCMGAMPNPKSRKRSPGTVLFDSYQTQLANFCGVMTNFQIDAAKDSLRRLSNTSDPSAIRAIVSDTFSTMSCTN